MFSNHALSRTTQQLKENVSNQHQHSPSLKGKRSHSLKEKSWSLLQVNYGLNNKKRVGEFNMHIVNFYLPKPWSFRKVNLRFKRLNSCVISAATQSIVGKIKRGHLKK
jgi:hypothetical protein